jgi:hypothetical protein
MDQAPAGFPDTIRHVSPDGWIVLDLVPGYDPRDIHEMQCQYRPKVICDGAVLLNLAGVPVDTRFEWQSNDLKLTLGSGLEILISPSDGIFSTSHDGGMPHPIADLNGSVHKILNPEGDHDPTDFRRKRTEFKSILILLIFVAILVGLLFEAWNGRFYKRGGRIDTGSPITGWSLTCPDGRHVMMNLDADGSLLFERSIVAQPLQPVAKIAGRFENDRSVVDIDGTNATIWFDGLDGPPLRCRGG